MLDVNMDHICNKQRADKALSALFDVVKVKVKVFNVHIQSKLL